MLRISINLKNIDFNEKLTYRTASDVVINNAQPEVTLTAY